MEIVNVRLDALELDPANVRTHDERNIQAIRDSLTQFGQRKPIVAMRGGDDSYTVIAGNGTLEAARALGWEELAVAVAPENWTSDEVAAFAIADNRTAELAAWDEPGLKLQLDELQSAGFDISLLGFDAIDDGHELVDVVEDEAPEPEEEATTKRGDIYRFGDHRLMCGDSTDSADFARLMGGEQAECVWTDPPYGVAYQKGLTPDEAKALHRRTDGKEVANDELTGHKLRAFLTDAFENTSESCSPGASWYVAAPSGPSFTDFAVPLSELKIWRQTLVWVKNRFAFGRSDYHYQHESIFYGWLPNGAHRWHGARTKATVFDDDFDPSALKKSELVELLNAMRDNSTIVREDRPMKSEDHPTMKPVKLVARLLANSSTRGDIVLDPFGGSGSTLMACEQLNRRCFSMELDPIYCDVIVKRWETFTGQTAELLETN